MSITNKENEVTVYMITFMPFCFKTECLENGTMPPLWIWINDGTVTIRVIVYKYPLFCKYLFWHDRGWLQEVFTTFLCYR